MARPDVTHAPPGSARPRHLWQVTATIASGPRSTTSPPPVRHRRDRPSPPWPRVVEHATTAASSFAGSSFYGYAHGVAGIAPSSTSPEPSPAIPTAELAELAAQTLRESALDTDGVLRWGSGPPSPDRPCRTGATARPEWRPSSCGIGVTARPPPMPTCWTGPPRHRRGQVAERRRLLSRPLRQRRPAPRLADRLGGPYASGRATSCASCGSDGRATTRHRPDRRGGPITLTSTSATAAVCPPPSARHGGPRLWLPEVDG